MARFKWFLTLLPLGLLGCMPTAMATFDPDTICSLLINGTKIKDPRACDAWIECIDGQPISGNCSDNDFYDRSTFSCVPAQSIKCISSNPCATTSANNVFVADPYSCNGYYYCTSGGSAQGNCSAGLNFNPGTQDCIRNFPCVLPMSPDSYCNIVPDGVFIKNTSNCNGYESCWNGTIISGTCPGTFYYNQLTGECDYPANVDCVEVVTNPPNMPAPSDVCTAANIFISDQNSCNGYYLCHENSNGEMELIHNTCPSGRFFDDSNGGACVPRTQVQCSYDRCVGLGQAAIQMSSLSDDNCEGFALCQNGQTIGKLQCPNGEYFDEITQRCTTEVIKYPACTSTAGFSIEPSATTIKSETEDTEDDHVAPTVSIYKQEYSTR